MEKVFEVILEKAKAYCRDETDRIHMLTALEMAKKLLPLEGGNERIVIPAINMHDLGWHLFSYQDELKARKITKQLEEVQLTHKHELESAALAERILSELNYPQKEKRQIIEIISWHDTRTGAISREDMIVKDADRLSRYTPQCFELFCIKFNKTQGEFFDFLKSQIEKGLFTDSAKFLAREYLVKRRLGLSDVEFEEGISSKFYEFLIRLEGQVVKIVRGRLEEIAIRTAREKAYDVKKMIEQYLANRDYIDLKELQKDEEFCSIATQKVSIGGYIGVQDRETGRIIFHPDKKCINLPPKELKKTLRPPEYLHGFWDWQNRARTGEEFYSYYQGMNIRGEIIDKFQYVVPLNIKNARWALVVAADYDDFFKPIDILSKEIVESVGEVSNQVDKLVKMVEDHATELAKSNKHLQLEIAERKQTEQKLKFAQDKLIQSEKLADISQIAAEAAHEVKNPLAVIKAGLYYLKKIIPKEEKEAQKTIYQLNDAVGRAISYINNLLSFSRPSDLNLKPVNINEVIDASLRELPPCVLDSIEIKKDFETNLPQIMVDSERLKQVFTNIIKNASESMEGVESKELKVESREEEGFVRISISDTGKGIPEEELDKIFDPFFTTKGKGTGLGLGICQRIMETHNGEIEVASEVGKGTTFILRLSVISNRVIGNQVIGRIDILITDRLIHHRDSRGRINVKCKTGNEKLEILAF